MALKYARIDAIAKRLSGRVSIINQNDLDVFGVTGTKIGTDLLYLIGEGVEEMLDMYLGMIYYLPLENQHPFLSSIAEKLVCSEVYLALFPTQGESSENADAYTSVLRNQALSDFQTLFDGLGIYVPGATNTSNSYQNDEMKQQQTVKCIILSGEKLKSHIGYDIDDDGIVDTDMFKRNTNIDTSFFLSGMMEKLSDSEETIKEGVRVKPRNRNSDIISFW